MARLTDGILAEALKHGHIEDKQLKFVGKDKKSQLVKNGVKQNYYSFVKVCEYIHQHGFTLKPAAIRQRIYAVNNAMEEAGVKQKWVAKRAGEGRPKKVVDTSLFTI